MLADFRVQVLIFDDVKRCRFRAAEAWNFETSDLLKSTGMKKRTAIEHLNHSPYSEESPRPAENSFRDPPALVREASVGVRRRFRV